MNNDTTRTAIQLDWQRTWASATADWSRYVQLREPVWCCDVAAEEAAGLSGGFAMIRLNDHAVVVSIRQVAERGLERFAGEILAHEVGHHVYCPGDLTDNARLLARVRRGLPGCETYAPLVANLYADLLINDVLQREIGRDMLGVYRALKSEEATGPLWQWYMRIYELLWSQPPKTLTSEFVTERINQDALLGARLIRVYHRDWLSGAGRFACLALSYVAEEAERDSARFQIWCDTIHAGLGGFPEGLTEIDEDELTGIIHPAEDTQLSGLSPVDIGSGLARGAGRVPGAYSGRKSLKTYRDPFEYGEILKAAGVELSAREIAVRYYRERALPYLIPFPERIQAAAVESIPEGHGLWDPADALEQIDWFSTLIYSPEVIPGVTTKERIYGDSPSQERQRRPLDLYLGVDCSGSMGDPAYQLSYPVLAGTVMALSALRAGASVKVVLSGEPGKSVCTEGFIRNQSALLTMLLNYLGTGYSFGIHRLAETYTDAKTYEHPSHILIVSDYDMFSMLDEYGDGRKGWDVACEAVQKCKGGATYVLQLPGFSDGLENRYSPQIERMRRDGWNVHLVNSMDELLVFAREFSRIHYELHL